VANTDPKNEHAGDSENSPPMEGAGAIASFIVAIAHPLKVSARPLSEQSVDQASIELPA